jgi:hypothetical protein
MFNMRRYLMIVALSLAFHPLCGQQDTGVITGKVLDESGAPIANASVEIKNVGTGIASKVITSQDGSYTTPPLRIGTYSVTVEAKGFKRAIRDNLILNVQDRLPVSFTLPVGDVQQSIEVMGEAPILQSETSSLGQVVDTRKMVDLPLNGRNFIQLITLSTGAYVPQPTNSSYQSTLVSINGNRIQNNNFMLDGVNNNTTDNNQPPVLPNPDAIAEFKVLTNMLPAEFGRGLGGTIIVNIKAGTNQYHGTVFEFLRNEHFDANPYFNSGRAKVPYQQNQFGFSLGGPVVFPKIYNGRNKTFFFGDYQGTRIRQGLTKVFTVPTAAMQAGNFSGFGTIYDPESTQPASSGNYSRTPFPNNQIPSNRFDPIMQKLAAFYPLPNSGPAQFAASNFVFNPKLSNNADQGDTRLDHRFNDRDSFFWSFSISDNTQIAPMNLPGIPFGGYFNDLQLRPQVFRGQHMSLAETHIFSPRLVNEIRVGYNRFFYTASPLSNGVNLGAQFGIPGIPTFSGISGLPSITTTGLTNIGEALTSHRGQNVRQVLDNVSYTNGRHSLKFGFDHRRTEFNLRQGSNSQGSFSYTGVYTNDPTSRAGGQAYADFLLAYPVSSAIGTPLDLGARVHNYSVFAQDDWRATSRLTLNLGVRYEYTTPVFDVNNRLANFDTAANNLIFAKPGGIEDRSTVKPDYNNFAPRIGLAYQPGARTVIRSGYGIFYTLEDAGYHVWSANPPFLITTTLSSDQTTPSTSPRPAAGFPPVTAGTTLIGRFLSVTARPTDFPAAYSQQWNISVEHQLGSFLFEAAYVGNKAIKLLTVLPINNPLPGPGTINTRRPYAGWGGISDDGPFGAAMYNGLQAKVEKRLSAGLSFLVSYSFAKALDDSDSINLSYPTAGVNSPQNPQNLRADWGLGYNDVRHRLVASYVYELPFGKGKRWLNNAHPALDAIAGGWQTNGIWSAQTGLPFTIQSPSDTSNTGTGNIRPNATGLPTNLPSGQRSVNNWLNTAAFVLPTGFAFGNVGRNTGMGPGLNNWDISAFKNFKLTERPLTLQFRAELFNSLNHPNFGLPGRTFNTATFGVISTTTTSNRDVQFALKLIF